jgi:dihydrodipicolinate synthase/N-acetylneuraminate lyase
MIALTVSDRAEAVAAAISAAGGTPIIAPVGVPGVEVVEGSGKREQG